MNQDLRKVYLRICAIFFFGTTHRGSQWADWGKIANNIATAMAFDTNSQVLRSLTVDSEILETLREGFARIFATSDNMILVDSFQEQQGFAKTRAFGMSQKVGAPNPAYHRPKLTSFKIVEDASSALEDAAKERKHGINADHKSVVKFHGKDDDGYEVTLAALLRHMKVIRDARTAAEKGLLCDSRSVTAEVELVASSTDRHLSRMPTEPVYASA